MGRQGYHTRLALGLSAYEEPDEEEWQLWETAQNAHQANRNRDIDPDLNQSRRPEPYVQQYDRRGYPVNKESRSLVRSLIRAKNEVLATVGACVGTQGISQGQSSHDGESVNKTGGDSEMDDWTVILQECHVIVSSLASWWITGVRYRLLAFHSLADIPLRDTIKSQWRLFGPRAFLLAGFPAELLVMVATVGFDEGVDALERIIYTKLAYREQSLKRRRRWKRLLGYLKSFLKMGWFLLCTPYISYAVLQRLGLVPATPIIPGLRVFSRDYLTCLSRFGSLPTEWTPPAVESWISALELSPLLRLCASAYMKNQADNFLVPVIQRSLSSISFPGIFWASTRTQKAGSRDEQPEAQEKSTISQPRTGLGAGLLMRFQSMREAILQGFRRQEASPTATATALPFEEENQQHQDAPNTPIASATVPSSPNHNEIDMAQTTPSLASHESSPMEPPVTGIRLAHHRGDDSGTALLELEVTRLQRRHGRSSSNDNSNQDLRQIPRLDSSREPDTDPDVSNFTTKPWAMPLRWLRDWASEDVAALLLIPIKAHFLRTLTVSFLAAEGLGNIRARAEPLTSPTGLGVSSSQARWSVEEIRLWLESPLSLALMRRVGETFLIDILLGIGVSGIGYLGIWWYTSRYLKEEEPETLVEQEQEQEHEHHEV